jgi:hypothetical protein
MELLFDIFCRPISGLDGITQSPICRSVVVLSAICSTRATPSLPGMAGNVLGSTGYVPSTYQEQILNTISNV